MGFLNSKPPVPTAGEISSRTRRLRPPIRLDERKVAEARQLRRDGLEPDEIAARIGAPLSEVEKSLLQMRSRQQDCTRGTLNVTLAARDFVLQERQGDEPIWRTVDRVFEELLQFRASSDASLCPPSKARRARVKREAASFQDLPDGMKQLFLFGDEVSGRTAQEMAISDSG